MPITFGVLTTNSVEEALARAGDGPSNKGHEAAVAAIEMASVVAQLTAAAGHVVTRARKKDHRHRAREAALQILYQWDIGRGDVDRAAETFFTLQWPDADPPPDALREFASALARDTAARIETIDPLIAGTAERWRPERMAVLDRLILRMAVCEMLRDPGRRRPPWSSTKRSSWRARSAPRSR